VALFTHFQGTDSV